MKKIILNTVLVLAVLLPGTAFAAEFQFDNKNITVEQNETPKNLYIAGKEIQIKAPVKDDLVIFGTDITIDNAVENSLFGAGSSIKINKSVGDNVRVIASDLSIDSSIQGDLMAVGSTVELSKNSSVDGDVVVKAANTNLNGKINGSVKIYGGDVVISGQITGDVFAHNVKSLTLADNTKISGKLVYSAPKSAQISEAAKVTGVIDFQKTTEQWTHKLWTSLIDLLATFIFVLLLVYLLPKFSKRLTKDSFASPVFCGLYGLIAVVVTPIIIFLLATSVIGLEISLALFLIYLLLVIIAIIFIPVVLGAVLTQLITKSKEYEISWLTALVGFLVFQVVAKIPVLGPFIDVLFFLIVFGGLIRWIFAKIKGNLAQK